MLIIHETSNFPRPQVQKRKAKNSPGDALTHLDIHFSTYSSTNTLRQYLPVWEGNELSFCPAADRLAPFKDPCSLFPFPPAAAGGGAPTSDLVQASVPLETKF